MKMVLLSVAVLSSGMLTGRSVYGQNAATADVKPEVSPAEKERQRIAKWEPQIKKFEEEDAVMPPPQGAVLFVGSSSIKLWKQAESFPSVPTINRGFGGSQLADSVHYAQRVVTKHKPRVVVLYAGDNDLGSGKSPEQVAADFAAFITKIRSDLPQTRIVYIGIKPSLQRWKLIEKVRDANRRIREIAAKHERVVFVDVEKPMLNSEGTPRPELFVKDGLHMTPAGYEVWTSLVAPHLAP